MLERLKSLKDLLVLNDEAHHVHSDDFEVERIAYWHPRFASQGEIAAWLDFSATPKDQNGMASVDGLRLSVRPGGRDRIVKAPLIVDKKNDPKRPLVEPEGINRENVIENTTSGSAAVKRWQEHTKAYEEHLGKKPVLFVTAEKNVYADAIGAHLIATRKARAQGGRSSRHPHRPVR